MRAAGGALYLAGFGIMVWNIYQTVQGKLRDEKPLTDAAFDPEKDRPLPQAARRPAPVADKSQPVAAE
jgi:cytochrome c oxidase cbb3-type subunit 1